MPDDIAARNAKVLAVVDSWNRVSESNRRLLMLYRETKEGELIVDVLEFLSAFVRQEKDGKSSAWLSVCAPEIEKDESGQRHLAWTREHSIPLKYVLHKKLLPVGWPGFDGFAVNSKDPVMMGMQHQYQREVDEGLAIAAEKGFK